MERISQGHFLLQTIQLIPAIHVRFLFTPQDYMQYITL